MLRSKLNNICRCLVVRAKGARDTPLGRASFAAGESPTLCGYHAPLSVTIVITHNNIYKVNLFSTLSAAAFSSARRAPRRPH
jgi:hypothetical protein